MLPLTRGKERTAKTHAIDCSQKIAIDFVYNLLSAKPDKKTLTSTLESTPRTIARGKAKGKKTRYMTEGVPWSWHPLGALARRWRASHDQ